MKPPPKRKTTQTHQEGDRVGFPEGRERDRWSRRTNANRRDAAGGAGLSGDGDAHASVSEQRRSPRGTERTLHLLRLRKERPEPPAEATVGTFKRPFWTRSAGGRSRFHARQGSAARCLRFHDDPPPQLSRKETAHYGLYSPSWP